MSKHQPDAEPDVPVAVPVAADREHEWRVRMLIQGGFTRHQASRLSVLPGVDYRRAVRMLDAGADFKTIYDILS